MGGDESWERRLNPAHGLRTHWLKGNQGPGGRTNPQHPFHTQPEQGCTEQRCPIHWEQQYSELLHRTHLPEPCTGHSHLWALLPALAQALGNLSPGTLQQWCAGQATSLVARRGNRAPVPSLLGRQMASEGFALASGPVPSCGSWKASHLALPTPQKVETLLEVSGSSQHWGLCSTGELWPRL